MSDASATVLAEEIESAITGITESSSAKCAAHEPMARGVVVLLRVASVSLRHQAKVLAMTTAIATIIPSVIVGLSILMKVYGWIP